jgi:hypothetical protein
MTLIWLITRKILFAEKLVPPKKRAGEIMDI